MCLIIAHSAGRKGKGVADFGFISELGRMFVGSK